VNLSSSVRGGYLRFIFQYLIQLPIPTIPDPKPLAAFVQQMLDAQAKLRTAGSDFERGQLQQSIARLDGAIDALVYGLYGLTAEEIRIVEGA
jgi:adenine-specific DNA-methyltransferase